MMTFFSLWYHMITEFNELLPLCNIGLNRLFFGYTSLVSKIPEVGKMAKARLTWVDAAKGFLMILVVVGHYSGPTMTDFPFIKYIYWFHMPAFFILSGLFFKPITENSKLKNSWNSSRYSSFEDSKRFSLGGFYIPKYNSFTSYFDRIVYRAGLRYENTGLVLNNQSINDFGVTAGFGFPVGRNFTNLNLGVEYGQRGTTSKNLVRENYFNITIGLSFNDFWFKKRRFE